MLKTDNNKIIVSVETTAECDVKEKVKERIEKVLQEEVNQCSKDYFRSIKATVSLNLN